MLPLFDCRPEARGIIAVGHMATGVIAFGQFATGVIAVGQLARGVVAVGQLALGVVTVGQLGGGLVRTWSMLAVGGRASGLLKLSVIPRPAERVETPTVSAMAVARGGLSGGWLRLTARPGHGGFTWTEDGVPLTVPVSVPHGVSAALKGVHRDTEFLVKVTGTTVFDDQGVPGLRAPVPSHRQLVVTEIKPLAGQSTISVAGWFARGVLGVALALVVGQFALRPVLELFLE